MTKKIISWLSFLIVFSFVLQSCVHDEISTASDPASKEYTNKSLWKEDEKYIKNVMKVYFENESSIKKVTGEPFWDYAMTMNRFDESFLMVPVVENGKVISILNVPRHGEKVYFIYTNSSEDLVFFQNLISPRIKKAHETQMSSETSKWTCTTQTISMWYPDNESNPDGGGHWESSHITICKYQQMDECLGIVGPDGQCMGGGGDGGGYPYPGGGDSNPEPEIEDPCAKLKSQTTNLTFKNNITNLEGKTSDEYESGYRIGSNPDGSWQNQLLQNKPGTRQVDLKAFPNTVTLMHSHFDELYPMFSPEDIILFNKWIVWAQNWNSVPTNNPKIPLNNLTFTLVTSNGNYSFNFDGTSTTPFPEYTQKEIDDLNDIYIKLLDEAKTVANVSGNVTFDMDKVEKQFLKFINDKMNMEGLKLYQTAENGNTQLNLVNGNRKAVPCSN